MGFTVDDKQLKRAGLDYWHLLDITYYDNIGDFFSKNNGEFFYFTTKGQHIYSDVVYPNKAYIVFGREDAGLDEKLLFNNESHCVRLPMVDEARSLNLSNSVCVATYEVLRQWDFSNLKQTGELTKFTWNENNGEELL